MKDLLQRDKRGLSAMVGYVLLVVIGITLAVLVYGFLKIYVPNEGPVCPENVALSVEQVSCGNGVVKVKLMNRGLFNMDGAYIRIGESERVFRQLLNEEDVHFNDWASEEGLPPGEIWPRDGNPASFSFSGLGAHILEIEPAMYVDNEWTLCNRAIITQPIECTEGEFLASIEVNEPSGTYVIDPLSTVPISFSVSGENRQQCWYNVTDTSGVVKIPQTRIGNCASESTVTGSFVNPGVGSYIFQATLTDASGNNVSDSSSFNVEEAEGTFVLNSPNLDTYEFRNGTLNPPAGNIPLNYNFNGTAMNCRINLLDPFGQINRTINGCSGIVQMLASFFEFDEYIADYSLRFLDLDNNQEEVHRKDFGVLVDPDITLSTGMGGIVCTGTIDWSIQQRKYPLSQCYVNHYNSTRYLGYFEIPGCERTGSEIYNNLANDVHTFEGVAIDIRGRRGTYNLSVSINGPPTCNSNTGGHSYAQ